MAQAAAGLSPRRPRFNPKLVHERFMVDKLVLSFLSEYLVFSTASFHQCFILVFIWNAIIRRASGRSLGYFEKSNEVLDTVVQWKEQYFPSVRPSKGSQCGSNYSVHSSVHNNYSTLYSKTGVAVIGRRQIRILAHKPTTPTGRFTAFLSSYRQMLDQSLVGPDRLTPIHHSPIILPFDANLRHWQRHKTNQRKS
jgi:hypothetical protein